MLLLFSCTTTQLSSNNSPFAPYNPNPVDNAIDVSINPTLSWDCSDPDGDILTYDIYFGTTNPPSLIESDYSITSYDVGPLDYGTTYYWKIVARDGKGGVSSSPVWSFTTIKNIVLIAQTYSYSLDEGRYAYWENITIDTTGEVYGSFDLSHWDGDYGLEILLMTSSDFANFKSGYSYSAWHKSIYVEGLHSFRFVDVTPGNYVLIIDNSDLGWDTTDSDGVNDYAVLDFEAYFESY